MQVLVFGGTGTVGKAVVQRLLDAGHRPRVVTRSPNRVATLPAGVDAAVADLDRPETLPAALDGVTAAFLAVPIGRNETAQALSAVEACRDARLSRLVYLSVVMPPGSEVIPHFASKVPVERAVQESGIPWTILRPNNLFQNDLRSKDAIVEEGVYPQPLGSRGVNRVDVRDVAEAAVSALARGIGGIVPLHGPRGMTGDDTARIYAELLGRPVRYAGDDLDRWAARVSGLPDWMVGDLRTMFDFFIRNGVHASGRDFALQETLLGHAPRSFEAFAEELSRSWKR